LVLPILAIVITLTTLASTSLLQKVNSSNLANVSKVTKILDENIKSIEDITKIIVSDVDMKAAIGKGSADRENAFAMIQDRQNNYDNKI